MTLVKDTAKVLVIENPQEDPTILTVDGWDDVVVTTSSYLLSKYAGGEVADTAPDHFARLADRFPIGSPPWNELMRMQHELYIAQHTLPGWRIRKR